MKDGFPIRVILGALVLATALPFIALTTYETYARVQRETERAGAEALRAARAAAYETEDVLQRARELLAALAKRPNLASLNPANCAPIFNAFLDLYPEYINLLTVKRNGDRICNATTLPPGTPTKVDPTLFLSETLRTGNFTVGIVTRGPITGRWISVAAHPIRDQKGEIQSVVAVTIGLANLRLIPRSEEMRPGAIARVVDSNSTVIATNTASDKTIGRNVGAAEWIKLLNPDRETTGRARDIEGIDHIWGTVPIKGTTWFAGVGIPTEVVYAQIWDRLILNEAISILVLLLAIWLAYLIARSTIQPIETIVAAVRQATHSQTPSTAKLLPIGTPPAPRELQQLAGDFHAMLEAREIAEQRIARLMRIQEVLSGINSAIVRIRDRQELLDEACRIAFEAGRFPLVWIGLIDRASMTVMPTSSKSIVGEAMELPVSRRLVAEGTPGAQGLVGQAVHSRVPCISNDAQNDPRIAMHDEHRRRGIRSLVILPLLVGGETVGVLALHAAETGFFDQEEMKLLVELAGDIAFALDHIEKAERLDYLAYYDELTGLANSKLFHDRLEQHVIAARGENRLMGLVLVDIERFKAINDTVGRHAGDQLLKQIAERMRRHTVDPNRLARLSADHFAIAIPELPSIDVVPRRLEHKFMEWFSEPFTLNGTELRISAKVGIAIFPDDGAEADILFKNAEAALKRAKASGERYVFYTEQMTDRVAEKLTLENKLRRALEKEEFVLYYQPKVDLASGKVCAAEALIRWNDPATGLVPPGHFIPLLEETGLILEAGRWALRKAVDDHLRWRAAGRVPIRLAVNVSPLQLRHRDFVAEIEAVLRIDPNAAAGLEIEITESLIMDDVKRNIAALEAIRALGVSIAIDDFGTGYSSLSYLAMLPVDTLKIDRSFIMEMTASSQGLALVSTIITLAHSLKLKVVAEGVETGEQSNLLRLLNCNQMQGYLFSKPVPAEEFEAKFLEAAR